jgi:signal transduction histidine kinase
MADQKQPPKSDSGGLPNVAGSYLDHIIDLLPCYISIQDLEHRLLFVNQSFKNDFGDGTGKLCHTVYKGSSHICRACPVEKTIRDKRIHVAEKTVQLPDGKICQMLIQSSPVLDTNSEVEAIIEMGTNITQIKKSQKELTTLGQSIALLSHGIKNILEGLQGGAYVVDEAFNEGDIQLARKGWSIVNKNIFDITDVVQNILYSSKNRPLNYEMVSPGQLVQDAVQLFREKAAGMNIQLDEQINADLPNMRLDAAGIRRMLHNLIWNALEACHNDKEKKQHCVTVNTDYFDRTHFMFEIADNGTGMDAATQRNMLEEFFSTKGGGGTGLGLAVVEKVVNKHGGRIEIDSAPGTGTTFKIIFKVGFR